MIDFERHKRTESCLQLCLDMVAARSLGAGSRHGSSKEQGDMVAAKSLGGKDGLNL